MNTGTVRFSILAPGLLVLATGLTPGWAQQEPLHGLQPVEQQVADHGPLSTSLRWVQYGLREPYSFSELYRLPIGQKDYVRRNAGLWAVFPRSLYVSGEDGVVATVPAGTVYYIGGPADVMPQIANQQSAYVPVGQISPDRVDENRIEAELIDRRVPASSIQSNMSSEQEPPRSPEQPSLSWAIDDGIAARGAWIAAMPSFDFVGDADYRRRCLKTAMLSASGFGEPNDTRELNTDQRTEDSSQP